MNLPISWLKQFVNTKSKPQEIAEKLTLSGSEVEKIVTHDTGLSKIVVGQIKEIRSHPNASKLKLTYVDIGKKDLLEIVCGSQNIEEGQKVACVLVGGAVPGLKIEAREIRGIRSQGMLASEKELGLSDDHSGNFILPNDAKVGEDVVKLLELDEPILELDITPNRPDCFSIQGLSREVAALYGKKLNQESVTVREGGTAAASAIDVKIEDKKLCPKYCARVIQGVQVGQSPLWLANKVRQAGIRSINNIVDVTNYVLYELGHPLHSFDANLLEGNIIVRKAKKGEKLSALDEETYTLNPDMLVIADEKKAVAIAGVMGGMDTGVTEGTHNIVLESALFDPISVRKTSKSLGLRSESSSRFEKGVDQEQIEQALDMATSMIQDVAGGTILKGIVSAGVLKDTSKSIKLPITEVSRILGINVISSKVKSILQSLGFIVTGSSKILNVKIPSWRVHDVLEPIDLIEEIGRIMDYNTMPKTLPSTELTSPVLEPLHQLRHNLRHYLAGAGYSEILTYSFYDEASIKLSGIGQSHHIKLTNPVNDEYPYLRTSMLPWMLNKLSQNSSLLAREQFNLFEIGKVFHKTGGEHWQASIGLINTTSTDEQLFRTLRGLIESFIGNELLVEKEGKKYVVSKAKHVIGSIEVYAKGSLSGLRFRSSAAVMLINLEELVKITKNERIEYESLPYYPVVERDLGVVVPNVVQYKELIQSIDKFNPIIKKVQLFDVYHGLDKGASLALRLTFSSTDRTLEAKEVDEIMSKLRALLENKYKVSFR